MKSRMVTYKDKRQKGAVAVTVAILLILMIGFAALAVDIGYLMVTRNELQNVADAAALAAARQLGNAYQHMSFEEQQSYDCTSSTTLSCLQVIDIAQQVGLENRAAQANITIRAEDVVIGLWDQNTTPRFTVGTDHPNAVQVTARRDALVNDPITTFLAGVIGVETMGVVAQATAALTGQSSVDPGELELPVGISKWWFESNNCNDTIAFSPANSPESCAGWTSWEYNSNDANLRKILDETQSSPEALAGESIFNFIGGDLSTQTFNAMESLFQRKGYDIDAAGNPVLDINGEPLADATGTGFEVPLYAEDGVTALLYPDGTPRNEHRWPTTIVVYDRDDCSNPNQSILILGFARVTISEVLNAPDKSIKGIIECNYVGPENSRGGGGGFGTFGSIPGLVQ